MLSNKLNLWSPSKYICINNACSLFFIYRKKKEERGGILLHLNNYTNLTSSFPFCLQAITMTKRTINQKSGGGKSTKNEGKGEGRYWSALKKHGLWLFGERKEIYRFLYRLIPTFFSAWITGLIRQDSSMRKCRLSASVRANDFSQFKQ